MTTYQSTRFDAEIDGHLEFARSAVRSVQLGAEDRAALVEQFAAVERRLTDRTHRLAVIGEFSSGKSTFINALLGEELLPTGLAPTTAVALRIQAGQGRELAFRLDGEARGHVLSEPGGTRLSARGRATARARARLRQVAPGKVEGLRSALGLLCADPEIGGSVTELSLALPAATLIDELVVIDTPGANADDEHHVTVTREVLANEADAAVVVLSANTPVSDSLVTFLLDTLDFDLLSRCVFVVSWMDSIPSPERDDLLVRIRRRLERKLSLRSVTVLPAAPVWALRAAQGEALSADERGWADQFPSLVETLHTIMRRQRALASASTVLRLLDGALAAMQDRLRQQAGQLAAEQTALERLPIHDVAAFLRTEAMRGQATLEGLVTDLESSMSRRISSARGSLDSSTDDALDAARSKSALATCMRETIPGLVQNALAGLERTIGAELSAASGRVSSAVLGGLDRATAEQYRQFAAISGSGVVSGRFSASASVSLGAVADLSGLGSAVDAVTSDDNKLMGAGMASGALIGTAIAPVLGTAIGALFGAAIRMFGKPAKQVREQYKENVGDAVYRAFRDVRSVAERAVSDFSDAGRAALDSRVAALKAAYGPVIAEAMRRHQERTRAVQTEQASLRTAAAAVGERRSAIQATREAIAVQDAA
ncbi:dynamin family protein [Actinospica robiniae]|uniref:dynamin family protein n=1 Tax=Actinospica robiniae TaxID=304901 RepID=UPI000556B0EE|nr:dynamin family protein [Actinospica robiniae]